MRRFLPTFWCTAIVLGISAYGAAPNKTGQMVTGAIAYSAQNESDPEAPSLVY